LCSEVVQQVAKAACRKICELFLNFDQQNVTKHISESVKKYPSKFGGSRRGKLILNSRSASALDYNQVFFAGNPLAITDISQEIVKTTRDCLMEQIPLHLCTALNMLSQQRFEEDSEVVFHLLNGFCCRQFDQDGPSAIEGSADYDGEFIKKIEEFFRWRLRANRRGNNEEIVANALDDMMKWLLKDALSEYAQMQNSPAKQKKKCISPQKSTSRHPSFEAFLQEYMTEAIDSTVESPGKLYLELTEYLEKRSNIFGFSVFGRDRKCGSRNYKKPFIYELLLRAVRFVQRRAREYSLLTLENHPDESPYPRGPNPATSQQLKDWHDELFGLLQPVEQVLTQLQVQVDPNDHVGKSILVSVERMAAMDCLLNNLSPMWTKEHGQFLQSACKRRVPECNLNIVTNWSYTSCVIQDNAAELERFLVSGSVDQDQITARYQLVMWEIEPGGHNLFRALSHQLCDDGSLDAANKMREIMVRSVLVYYDIVSSDSFEETTGLTREEWVTSMLDDERVRENMTSREYCLILHHFAYRFGAAVTSLYLTSKSQ